MKVDVHVANLYSHALLHSDTDSLDIYIAMLWI